MKTEEKSEKINRILGIISAVIGIVGSIFGIFQAQQAATLKNEVNSLQTASQQTIVNVVSTLGDLPNNFLLVEHYLLPSPVRKRSCYRDLCVLLESGFLCFSPKPPVQSFSAIGILSVFFLPGPMVFA